MADTGIPETQPVRPSWKQIGAVLFAGMILVPGLCIGLASTSGTMDQAVTILFLLMGLSILLTFIGGIMGVVRILRDIRRR